MVITALLLICSIPQMDDTAKVVNDSPGVVSDSAAKDSTLIASLPSAPAPKVNADPEPMTPNPAAQPFRPVKPVFTRPRETPRQRKIWYGLTLAGHSGAAFDAWTTYRAVSGGYGREANPFMRPFKLEGDLCGDAGEPGVHGFLGQADDGEPAWLGKEDLVAATGGGREYVVCVRRA